MRPLLLVPLTATLLACSDSDLGTANTAPTVVQAPARSAPLGESFGDGLEPRNDIMLGDPLPDLTPAELAAFNRGREVFDRRFTPPDGLGPLYNATSCKSCHSTPVSGGSSRLYRNFYVAMTVVSPFFQLPLDGLPSIIVPHYGETPHLTGSFTTEVGRAPIPATQFGFPVISAQRNAIPIFGTGLFEFISDATIRSNADPNDSDADGISGRFNTDTGTASTSIGRFGVKAQVNNVEFFTRGPLQNQMGITTDPVLGSSGIASLCSALLPQAGSGADVPTTDNDGVLDPEMSTQDLSDLIAFTRFLAPPQPRRLNADGRAGRQLFGSLGCTDCHIPTLPSSRGPVNAYTDLLLHEMGPGLADGISIGSPQASTISKPLVVDEFRTQPLWGVSLHKPFMHDGGAETLKQAIKMHGGEAQASRDAFVALTPADKNMVIAFLELL